MKKTGLLLLGLLSFSAFSATTVCGLENRNAKRISSCKLGEVEIKGNGSGISRAIVKSCSLRSKKDGIHVNLTMSDDGKLITVMHNQSMEVIRFEDADGVFQGGIDRADLSEKTSIFCALTIGQNALKI